MLANAVSSALDRLYAAAPVDDRAQVPRVTSVPPAPRATEENTGKGLNDRDERQRFSQRRALTDGVRAVFESSSASEAGSTTGTRVSDGDRDAVVSTTDPKPDPLLEEAILRFIHTMFRSLAEAEGALPDPALTASSDGSAAVAAPGSVAASSGRSALGARIGTLAQRYADAASTGDATGRKPDPAEGSSKTADAGPSDSTSAAEPDLALRQAFAEVLQALRGNLGGGVEVSPNSRGELVNLMQRLAQAMQGAPPVDPGLPTRGGLLSTRA